MSTQFTNRQWRLPNNENKDKQSNYSMDFDSASSDYIDLGANFYQVGSGDVSISVWIKPQSQSGNNDIIAIGANTGSRIRLQRRGNNFGAYINNSAGSGSALTGSTTITNGVWYHLTLIKSGTTFTLYVNTTSEASGTFTGTFDSEEGIIGAYFGGVSNNINGQIDAVAIYNYALSSSQVTTLYGSSSTGIGNPMSLSPKPVAYYPLGDQDAFNGSSYLTPNSSLKDFVFDFDLVAGVGDLISATNTLPSSSDFTISLWVNPDSSQASYSTTIVFGNLVNGENLQIISRFGTGYFYVSNGSSAYISQSNAVQANVWTLITVTYNNTLGVLTAYLNGGENVYTSSSGTTLPTQAFGNLMYIGKYTTNSTSYQGKISNVQIFNSALPATGSNSVETLYNNGSPLTSMSGFTSLQGWWKLDASATYDSSTNTWSIPDDSTNSNTGTSSGMTQANLVQSDLSFTSGYSPYALNFDAASSDYIEIPDSSDLQLVNTDFSISFWINPSASGSYILMDKYGSGTGWGFYLQSGNLRFLAYPSGFQTVTTISQNVWTHILIVGDNSGDNLLCYKNGAEVYNSSYTLSISSNTTNLIIGSENGTSFFTNGKLSNLSIWNAALTSAQVTEIYSEGVPSNLNNHSAYSNLVSWWQLGSNSSFNTNWTVLDEKGSSNGTSFNMGEDAIVDGVGSYANGLSSGMGGDEVIGDAPYSTANALSVNMDVEDRVTDTPS